MGSKAVFGILLIGLGILGAYLAITGQLQAVWTGLLTGSFTSTNPSTATPTATSTPQAAVNSTGQTVPSVTNSAGGSPAALPQTTASQIQSALSDIQALTQYQPTNVLPSSSTTTPTAQISSLPSVYSTTLAQQSGVTGVIS